MGVQIVLTTFSKTVDAVRRQLRDAVRDDRAREVDRLTAGADERQRDSFAQV
jgi:hypothetical protein